MKEEYFRGFILGIGISTIFWCIAWGLLTSKIENIHRKELNYIIDKK